MDVLLRVAIARRHGRITAAPRLVKPSDLKDGNPPTARTAAVRALQREPVSQACRLAIRILGEHLFDVLGSTVKMREVAGDAAALVPRQYGRRIAIIDHAWNGIGAGSDVWSS